MNEGWYNTAILESIIIADAFASPLDNLSAQHIKATFGDVTEFVDPTPALKHKLNLWKKPGLYTSLSQYCILLCAINSQNYTYNHQLVINFLHSLGDSSVYFRHTPQILHNLNNTFDAPTAELLVFIPSLLFCKRESTPQNLLHFILAHNKNAATCVACTFFYLLLKEIIGRQLSILHPELVNDVSSQMALLIQQHSASIFEHGANPQVVTQAANDLYALMTTLPFASDEATFTQHVLNYANKWSTNSFTRLTVNHPFAILSFAFYCSYSTPYNAVFSHIHHGGRVSVLLPLIAAISAALYGPDSIPEHLKETLINKKRIYQLLQFLHESSITMNYLTEFFQNEMKLTQKEKDELESKLKHSKHIKEKPKKPAADKHNAMTNHVVESWTKLDKAKWKKEKKKHKPYSE